MSLNAALDGENGSTLAASVNDAAGAPMEPTFDPVGAVTPAAVAGGAAADEAASGDGRTVPVPAGEPDLSFDNDDEEDEEQSAFGNLFPRKKLANGMSEAGRLWGVLGSKVKETATKVGENPNVVAFKERSSETWGTVVDKTKQGVEKIKEVSAPVTSRVSEAASSVGRAAAPVTEPIRNGTVKAATAVSEKAKSVHASARESLASEDFQFGRKTIGSTLSSAAATTRESISNAPTHLKNAGDNIKTGVIGAKDAVIGLAARASTSGGSDGAQEAAEAAGDVPPAEATPAPNPNPPITV